MVLRQQHSDSNTPSNSSNKNSSSSNSNNGEQAGKALREAAPIAHINMQLFCICRKCATPRPLTPCGPIWYHSARALLLFFFYIYSTTSRAAGDVYDTCDFWATATAANWQQKKRERRGRGERDATQGKRRVSGNIMSVAGIGPHIVLCDIFICWFACNLFIFMRIICIWQIFMRPTKRPQPGAVSMLQHQQQTKRQHSKATDWSMNNKNECTMFF